MASHSGRKDGTTITIVPDRRVPVPLGDRISIRKRQTTVRPITFVRTWQREISPKGSAAASTVNADTGGKRAGSSKRRASKKLKLDKTDNVITVEQSSQPRVTRSAARDRTAIAELVTSANESSQLKSSDVSKKKTAPSRTGSGSSVVQSRANQRLSRPAKTPVNDVHKTQSASTIIKRSSAKRHNHATVDIKTRITEVTNNASNSDLSGRINFNTASDAADSHLHGKDLPETTSSKTSSGLTHGETGGPLLPSRGTVEMAATSNSSAVNEVVFNDESITTEVVPLNSNCSVEENILASGSNKQHSKVSGQSKLALLRSNLKEVLHDVILETGFTDLPVTDRVDEENQLSDVEKSDSVKSDWSKGNRSKKLKSSRSIENCVVKGSYDVTSSTGPAAIRLSSAKGSVTVVSGASVTAAATTSSGKTSAATASELRNEAAASGTATPSVTAAATTSSGKTSAATASKLRNETAASDTATPNVNPNFTVVTDIASMPKPLARPRSHQKPATSADDKAATVTFEVCRKCRVSDVTEMDVIDAIVRKTVDDYMRTLMASDSMKKTIANVASQTVRSLQQVANSSNTLRKLRKTQSQCAVQLKKKRKVLIQKQRKCRELVAAVTDAEEKLKKSQQQTVVEGIERYLTDLRVAVGCQ